jgi:hypothetical protein
MPLHPRHTLFATAIRLRNPLECVVRIMSSPGIPISVRNTFYLNLLNLVLFLLIGFTGSVIQLEYHMHETPNGQSVMGFNKTGWVLLHKASAPLFLAGAAIHCTLNWRFVSASTRRILRRRLPPSAPLSYWLFIVCVPTCFTAMVSWTLLSLENPTRFLLVETHDKLGWLLIILSVIHILSRTGRMTKAYRKLHQGSVR